MKQNHKILLMGLIAPPFFIGLFLLILHLDPNLEISSVTKPKPDPFKSACGQVLTQTLTDLQFAAQNVANLSRECYSSTDSACAKAHLHAKELMDSLDSSDLKLRFDHFSCSPLLFSKLRYMHKSAETIHILTSLKVKSPALETTASNLTEPNRFISVEMENIKKDCCIQK